MDNQITEYSGRAYTWSLISYASNEELQRLFDSAKHWAYAYHDKDTNEDGIPKEPHTHIIVTFEQQKSIKSIQDIIASEQNTLGECRRKCGSTWIPLNIKSLFDYLIHEGYPDKYQYDPEERVYDSTKYWGRFITDKTAFDSNSDFFNDLTAPYKSIYELELFMAQKHGKDYIKNRVAYLSFRNQVLLEELTQNDVIAYEKLTTFCIVNDISVNEAISTLRRSIDQQNGIFNRKYNDFE